MSLTVASPATLSPTVHTVALPWLPRIASRGRDHDGCIHDTRETRRVTVCDHARCGRSHPVRQPIGQPLSHTTLAAENCTKGHCINRCKGQSLQLGVIYVRRSKNDPPKRKVAHEPPRSSRYLQPPVEAGLLSPHCPSLGSAIQRVLTMRAADFAGLASPKEKWSEHEIFVPLDVP